MKFSWGALLRYAAIGLLALVLAGLLALSYLVLTFEPNDYREELVASVEERTGRAFAVDGDLELHLDLPLVGFEVHGVTLDNAVGFGQESMLAVKRAEVYLQVLPLLRGDLQVHSMLLDGMHLRLRRKASGHSNWDDLKAAAEAPDAATESDATRAAVPGIQRLQLTDATIALWDDLRGRRMRVAELDLVLERAALDGSVRLEMGGEAMIWSGQRDGDRINAALKLGGTLEADATGQRITGRELEASWDLAGSESAFESMKSEARAESFVWDRAADSVQVQGMRLQAEGAELDFMQLHVRSASHTPEAVGRVGISGIDARRWLELFGMAMPELADPEVLQDLSGSSEFRIHPQGLHLSGLDAMLDAMSVRGDLALLDFAQPRIVLSLQLGELALDRYLPAPAQDADDAAASSPAGAERGAEWPLEWLRRQNIDMQLKVETLRWKELALVQPRFDLTAVGGLWKLDVQHGRLGAGTFAAGLQLDASGGVPHYQGRMALEKVELAPLLALRGESGPVPVSGTTDLTAELKARGYQAETFWPSLGGSIQAEVRNGALQVGSVAQAVESAVAVLQGRPKETVGEGRLPFDFLRARWQATDGRLANRDLELSAGAISVTGQGYIDVPGAQVDYQLNVVSGDGPRVPVRISGPFDDLSHSLDLSALIKKPLEDAVKKPKEFLDKLRNRFF